MIEEILSASLLMLIMIDPSDKILLVSLLREDFHIEDIKQLIIRANLIGFILLIIFALAGKIILQDIFHIDLNALKVAGGFVLFKIGLEALEGGGMVTLKKEKNILALAAVPVATPLIAGPAAITTAITLTAEYGLKVSASAILIAILLTALLMFVTLYMIQNIKKTTLGVFIRIIGLFTMAIGAQMMVEGVGGIFLRLLQSSA
ncbi:MarC family protein [Thermococcus sp. M39]|uniref:MarC family protein n=1 Tax=unclassified Thermococcus TaxID=2627626 RepID=UPI001438F04E|nr:MULTISPECIES: MarC family protein [unclassified Thermococcus]NJE08264.1 MarC family protein [Thermococcus sp. M39]NJE11757.1 MarC family protein [Thermococcus sp. LS2]